jgi:hypothetical protein
MNEDKDKPRTSIFRSLRRKSSEETKAGTQQTGNNQKPIELTPALPELGTTPCPVCQRRVTVFVTRTKRPFINCGYCCARIFYNGSRSMQILRSHLKASKKGGG